MVVCASFPPAAPHKNVCCIIDYNFQGINVGNNACVIIGDGFSTADCTRQFNFNLLGGGTVSLPYGAVAECCHDCFPGEKKLVISGGRLIRNGGQFATTGEGIEKCCCNDECVCKEVPDCKRVRCYGTPNPSQAEKCKGQCISYQYDEAGDEILEDRDILCATQIQCCDNDGGQCSQTCVNGEFAPGGQPAITYDPPENSWLAMPCTTCGVCCFITYGADGQPTGEYTADKTVTEAECNVPHPDPTLGPLGIWHAATEDLNICNPECCKELTRGDEIAAACRHTTQKKCDPCVGKCIDLTVDGNPVLCPQETCKTKTDCCGDGGENCKPNQCGADTPALFSWDAMDCGTDPDMCGACCKETFNLISGDVIDSECVQIDLTPGTLLTKKEACENQSNDDNTPIDQRYVWYPFGTCALCARVVPCCRELNCPDGKLVKCVDVLPADCDMCNGKCVELATGTQSCASKQACCGEDGSQCTGVVPVTEPDGCGGAIVPITHSWSAEEGCANAENCGKCCVHNYDAAGNIIDSTCAPTMWYAICVAQINVGSDTAPIMRPTGTWYPFATCESLNNCLDPPRKTRCVPVCPESSSSGVECRSVTEDFISDEDAPPCHGPCIEIATGDSTCKTKWGCCGQFNELCTPDCDTPATHSWHGQCGGVSCGICCLPAGVDQPEIMSEVVCGNLGGVWHPDAEEDYNVCGPYKCCHEVTMVSGRTKVFCKPSDEECPACEGLCSAQDPARPGCPNETCAPQSECCDPCTKCSGPTATNTWTQTCDYRCPGCCCTAGIGGLNDDYSSEAHYGIGEYECTAECGVAACSSYSLVSDCANCRGQCYDYYGPDEPKECYSNNVVESCSDCCGEGQNCSFNKTFGFAGTWQEECDIAQVYSSCPSPSFGPYKVKITGERPLVGYGNGGHGPVDYETTVYWGNFGTGPRYGNGGNNGYVGIFPTCDGWAAYFYTGSWSLQEPDPTPSKAYPYCPDRDLAPPTRTSIIKELSTGNCSITGSYTVKAIGFDGAPVVGVIVTFFDLNIEITEMASMTAAAPATLPSLNPFP